MTGLHDSTLGLSVYTAIVRHGAGTREQILVALQANWMPTVELHEVQSGARYLAKRRMILETDGGVLAAARTRNGVPLPVVRDAGDNGELLYMVRR